MKEKQSIGRVICEGKDYEVTLLSNNNVLVGKTDEFACLSDMLESLSTASVVEWFDEIPGFYKH